jgi:hypothetical protein
MGIVLMVWTVLWTWYVSKRKKIVVMGDDLVFVQTPR